MMKKSVTKRGPGSRKKALKRYLTDIQRWRALVERDPLADCQFFYAVKTTGIYCRPSCGARLARRENVIFFETANAAEMAGFRPCRRCRPDGLSLAGRHANMVAEACRAIESAEELPNLKTLARAAGLSRYHFHRLFSGLVGLTPKEFAMARRAERARRETGRRSTVTEAIYEAGFNSSGRFYEKSGRMFGMKPKRFRDQGAGEAIHFAVDKCDLGFILVAATEQGICAISLGDEPDPLTKELKAQFSRARLITQDPEFKRVVTEVVRLVEAPRLGWNLPMDVRGTAFQRRVWKALREIPAGATVTYAEIAKRLGNPRSGRAVARACAANRIAVGIPCHRIVRADGKASGYRWGLERKRRLQRREQAKAPD